MKNWIKQNSDLQFMSPGYIRDEIKSFSVGNFHENTNVAIVTKIPDTISS